jgi:FtsH-binding integral membrane protein
MADLRYQSSAPARGHAAEIDQGLRSYMLGVYNYMALGVAATAIITLFVASTPALLATAVSCAGCSLSASWAWASLPRG